VVYMLQDMGIECGVDLTQLIEVGRGISARLERGNQSKVALAKSY
jgi:hypothetical protein